MKKTIAGICSVALLALALSSCDNTKANEAAMNADNTAIDQMVSDKIKTLDDSMSKECTAKMEREAKREERNEEREKEKEKDHGTKAHTTTPPTAHHSAPAGETPTDPKKPGAVETGKGIPAATGQRKTGKTRI